MNDSAHVNLPDFFVGDAMGYGECSAGLAVGAAVDLHRIHTYDFGVR
jgi:hypothetical protein